MWQVSLLTESGQTKDDLKLPTDDQLLAQVTSSIVYFLSICNHHFDLILIYLISIFSYFHLIQIKAGFDEGKDLVVTVMSAMGEEQICSLKDIGPK